MRNKLALLFVFVILVVGVTYKVTHRSGLTHDESAQNDLNHSTTNPDGTVKTEGQNPNGVAGGTTSGTTGANGASGSSVGGSAKLGPDGKPIATAEVKPEIKNNCFSFEYKHKASAQSRDIEEFLDDSNAFPILHANVNKSSVCVKVNQKPVAFKVVKGKSNEEVLIGSVVGPDSVIKVSYCTGKAQCKENCNLPKKRFMDDLMEDASNDDSFHDSWGKNDNDADRKELKNKAKELRTVASENANLNEKSIIRDWDSLQKNEWVCKEK
jgi:hypothetical protein